MIGPNSVLEKTLTAGATVAQHRIVKKGASEDVAIQAAAATDNMFGVSQHGASANEDLRIMLIGISKVEAGGTIAQGARVTADANGKAVAASSTNAIVGIAMGEAVDGDIMTILLTPGHW